MILLTGIPSEPPLRLAIEAAEQAGIPFALFNQRESQHSELDLHMTGGRLTGTIRLRERSYALDEFTGVYVRLMDHQHLPENQAAGVLAVNPEQIERSFAFHDMLFNWLEMTDCRVLNRNSAMASNMSKPYQAQLITQAGFRTPDTLITNQATEVRQFLKQHGRVIYKSISAIRSIVEELQEAKLAALGNLRYLPTQFQAFIPGKNIRVHVVGDSLFATEICSDAVDYRYASRENKATEMCATTLPPAIQCCCFKLSALLNLPLCGIDLKVTPHDEYFCFEVNPSPGYSYYQQHTGQDMATALVNYLAFGKADPTSSPRERGEGQARYEDANY